MFRTRKRSLLGEFAEPASGRHLCVQAVDRQSRIDRRVGAPAEPLPPHPRQENQPLSRVSGEEGEVLT